MIAIGVDAGGTGTRALLSSGGVRHAELDGGPANASAIGAVAAARAIADVVRAIAGDARPAAIVVGAAGAGRTRVAETIDGALRDLFPGARIAVGDDTPIALRAAIPSGPGIVLVAGTGSVAYAEHAHRRVRVGGAGYLLGDEGSAFSIGLAAIRLYARVLDDRAHGDETTALVARALDAPDRDALLAAVYDEPLVPARVAALAPSIVAFAGKGNRAATKIVQSAAQELGELVRAAARAADLAERSPRIALSGGLFAENSLLSFLLETRINGDLPGAEIVRGGDPPVAGALRLAEALAVASDDDARVR
jgi:N-acetylglucosamine kinase-like BadF-type ATPase